MNMFENCMAGLLLVAAATSAGAQGSTQARLDRRDFYDAMGTIEVSGMEYVVEVEGEDRRDIEVAVYTEEPNRVRIEQTREALRITVRSRLATIFSRAPQGRIELRVPRNASGVFRTASGAIAVHNLDESRAIEVGSASGSVSVRNVSGEVVINTASGSVRVEDVAGPQRIDTASGRIVVRDARGNIVGDSASGSHTYERITGDIEADSGSGQVSLRRTEGTVQITTASGQIRGDDVLLTGDSHFRSVSGSIRVDLANDLDDVRFDAKSVSGQVRIGSSRGKRLSIGSGRITVSADTTSGSQTFE